MSTIAIALIVLAVLLVVALTVFALLKPHRAEATVVEEPDQVELPDHRIVDRDLAQIIGAPTTAWGESERHQYRPEDYDGALHCLTCQREILPGQWFWETPLLSKQTRLPLGASFQTCLSCQPGDVEANIHGQ